MKGLQHKHFLTIFVAVFVVFHAVVMTTNYLVDPFFKYREEKQSISTSRVSIPYNEILVKLPKLERSDARKFIFGDSRGNMFNQRITNTHEQDAWFNFSIGGASPLEVLSTIEHTLSTKGPDHIDEVLLVMPLRLFVDRRINSFPTSLDLIQSDLLYLTNTLVFTGSYANVIKQVSGDTVKTQKQKGKKSAAWKSWVKHAELKVLDWQKPNSMMERYESLFETLRKHEIQFTIMLPPVHNDIKHVYRDGMPEIWSAYHNFYARMPETINCMDYSHNENHNRFNDPYHADSGYAGELFQDFVLKQNRVCVNSALAQRAHQRVSVTSH